MPSWWSCCCPGCPGGRASRCTSRASDLLATPFQFPKLQAQAPRLLHIYASDLWHDARALAIMGSYCSSLKTRYQYGYKSELSTPFLEAHFDKLNNESSCVIVVYLTAIREKEKRNLDFHLVYVDLKLLPGDKLAGEQSQKTSVKTSQDNVVCPKWESPERFQFIISSKDIRSRILLSYYEYRDKGKSYPLGDTVLQCNDVLNSSQLVYKTLKLINPANGSVVGDVDINVQVMTPYEARKLHLHSAYEYERWQPVVGWGNYKHFLPSDPGRWSTSDGKRFSDKVEDVVPMDDHVWKVSKNWYTVAHDGDGDGWYYSVNFKTLTWFSVAQTGTTVVRRRMWNREVELINPDFSPLKNRSSTSRTSTGRLSNVA